MCAKNIVTALIDYLKDNDWKYTFDEKKSIIETGVKLEEKISVCHLHIVIEDEYILNYGTIDINADEKIRNLVSEFLTRANYGLILGNFEIDFNDGEIRYKVYFNCNGVVPTEDVLEKIIVTPAMMFKRYADGLVKVLFGLSSPKEAIDECEQKDFSTD